MISAEDFILKAKDKGFDLYSGVPCSYLKPFINYIITSDKISYIPAASEGDAIGIAAGSYLGGRNSVVMLQNSGLGNTVNPITSLLQTFKIPILVIVTLRGDPGRPLDEPQHQLMGKITTDLLELMELDWGWFPETNEDLELQLDKAYSSINQNKKSFVMVMKKGSVEPYELKKEKTQNNRHNQTVDDFIDVATEVNRNQVLQSISEHSTSQDLIIATTGYTGRELYSIKDQPNNFYMVGSMGCAIDIGLGLALSRPEYRIIVIDGDGSLLMRLGALTTVGYESPKNLIHLVLDNGTYESTGSQETVSQFVDFKSIALASNYTRSFSTNSITLLERIIGAQYEGTTFIHFPISSKVKSNLPRPKIKPHEVTERFRNYLGRRAINE
tara:strand:+ start:270 stop:1424 length:1155 start_codon:yes stop_codon:yes gene_type:complete